MLKKVFISIALAAISVLCLWAASSSIGDNHTPQYYETSVEKCFKSNKWGEGKKILDEGLSVYPNAPGLNELAGKFYYNYHRYDDARYYFVLAIRGNDDNVTSRQYLVNIEEKTNNFSSAICYVNELLEVNPYWKGLWLRKIKLYRRQGNDVEADRLLKRLAVIYPNDVNINKQLSGRLEENYLRSKREGKKSEAIKSLQNLIDKGQAIEEYYLDLANMQLQQGQTSEAINTTTKGLNAFPRSMALARKKVGMLAESGRMAEAMLTVRELMRVNHSSALRGLYDELEEEAAREAAMNDPYTMYGKIYERKKDNESLTYLLNTAMSRGYDDDALYYIAEQKKREGNSKRLMYMEYQVNKRMGNVSRSTSLLKQLYNRYPQDRDIADELANFRMENAGRLMANGMYKEALTDLYMAENNAYDADTRLAARGRIYSCLFEMGRYDDAAKALDTLYLNRTHDEAYYLKKADILNKTNETTSALNVLFTAARATSDKTERAMLSSAYEEMAIPFIKRLGQNGATNMAYNQSRKLLELVPASHDGLVYAINNAAALKKHDEFDLHVEAGRSFFPTDTFFIAKQAESLARRELYANAIDLLRPLLDSLPGNLSIARAFAGNSQMRMMQLIKEKNAEQAIAIADTALKFYPGDRQLLYAKGLAYEEMHLYDSAYVYQKYYIPSAMEQAEFKHHLALLSSRNLRNEIALEYLQGRYGEEDILTSVATVQYTRKAKNNNYTGRINYSGRSGDANTADAENEVPGGVGLQLWAEWEHSFKKPWRTTASLAYGTRYFPVLAANIKAEHDFKNDWTADLHAGYRIVPTYKKTFAWNPDTYNEETKEYGLWEFDNWDKSNHGLLNVGLGATKTIPFFSIGGKADAYVLSNGIYFNASAVGRYFPFDDNRASIYATAGAGTAPETGVIDNALPGSFEKLNSMVGLGGSYMINKNLSIGLDGTWHTFYLQQNHRSGGLYNYIDYTTTRYKNLFNVHLQLLLRF